MHGNSLNVLEKLTGALLLLGSTMFATFNRLPTLLIVLPLPILLVAIRPADADVVAFVSEAEAPSPPPDTSTSPARRMDRSPVGGLLMVALRLARTQIGTETDPGSKTTRRGSNTTRAVAG